MPWSQPPPGISLLRINSFANTFTMSTSPIKDGDSADQSHTTNVRRTKERRRRSKRQQLAPICSKRSTVRRNYHVHRRIVPHARRGRSSRPSHLVDSPSRQSSMLLVVSVLRHRYPRAQFEVRSLQPPSMGWKRAVSLHNPPYVATLAISRFVNVISEGLLFP